MSTAYRDENGVHTIIAASKNDGTTIVRVLADPSTHKLIVNDNVTGSDHGLSYAKRDVNQVPVWIAVSSADGITPIEVYGDPSTGALWIDSV